MKGFDYMKNYNIFLSANNKKLEDKALMRIDLFDNMKIKDIEELKNFNVVYISKGHEDTVYIKNSKVTRNVRYIQIFKKQFIYSDICRYK